MTPITFGSVFTGIGGLDLGLEWAGMKCKWQIENEKYCLKVLEKHWPNVPRYGDIYETNKKTLERVDGICAGFPCQPFSHAGNRKGTADERWLWPPLYETICEVGPRWVLVENVPGLITIDSGRVFSGILRDLAEAGYDAEWFMLRASDFGAPHKRERLFIVAHTESTERQSAIYTRARGYGLANSSKDVANAIKFDDDNWRSGAGQIFRGFSKKTEIPRSQYWTTEPDVCGMANGFSTWLDNNGGIIINTHKSLLTYGNEKKDRTREILRVLWGEAIQKKNEWKAGRLLSFSEKEILLTYLCKLKEASETLDNLSFKGTEMEKEIMRELWNFDESSCPPYRPEHKEQLSIKYPNLMSALSQLLTLHSREAWESWENKNACTLPIKFGRVAEGIPSRVDRLKGLGNAVVPQIGKYIGRLIIDYYQK